MNFKTIYNTLDELEKNLPSKYWSILRAFFNDYLPILEKKNLENEETLSAILDFCQLVHNEIKAPSKFESFHKAVREPIDTYKLGNLIFEPVIDLTNSSIRGLENLEKINQQIAAKENVILYANHQSEADPQGLSILIKDLYPKLAEEMIFVAGERVVTDPLAIPMSMGRNLYCIYSKKYFEAHSDRKPQMLEHNKLTMLRVGHDLAKGSKCIYIAPAGGRDRPGKNGEVEVAPFDPQSIELLYLLGKKSKKPTHFYPLSLKTYNMLPPPDEREIRLGETRKTNETPIHIHFGEELNMESFSSTPIQDKKERKLARTQYIWEIVSNNYRNFP